MPRLDRLGKALSHDYNFQNVLALVYSDILEFHRRAYKFVRRKCESLATISLPFLINGSLGYLLRLHVGWLRDSIQHHPEASRISW